MTKGSESKNESRNIRIVGVGGYLPKRVLTNFDLEKMVDTTDDWIVKRTGIRNRHIANDNESTSDMAVQAVMGAIKNAGMSLDDIDMIICATTTPDYTFPSTACIIQSKLKINRPIIAFDVQAVCSGFVYALSVANDMMKCRNIRNAVVVGADKMSSIVDWNDRNTCVLFGDGAGAVVLRSTDSKEYKKGKKTNSGDDKINVDDFVGSRVDYSILDSFLSANGSLHDLLYTTGGVSLGNTYGTDIRISDVNGRIVSRNTGSVKMSGQVVFKHAIEKMVNSIKDILGKNGFTIDDVDLIVSHQANSRIISAVSDRLGVPVEKFMITIEEHANTSSASIPLALDVAVKDERIKSGDLIVFEAFGGGFTWGASLLRAL